MNLVRQMLLTLLCGFLTTLTVWAQDTVTGAFEGTVTNSQTGDPIAGATAEITNIETGITLTKLTDARGRFYQGLLTPGVYRIRVSQTGYQTQEVLQRLQIARTGEVVPVPVSLEPATAVPATPTQPNQPAQPTTPPTAGQPVPRTAPPGATPTPPTPTGTTPPATAAAVSEVRASINTLDGQRSGSFNETQLTLLPLGGVTLTRTFDELALLLPGVAPAPPTLGVAAGPGQGAGVGTSGQFAVNGLRSRGNNFTVDGSDNNDEDIGVRRQGFTALVPQTVESVREYQTITLLAPAQFGRNLGGNVNAVSRTGGSQMHGNAYGFFNASQLNARNPFDTANGAATTPLTSASNQRVILRQLVNGTVRNDPITVTNQSGGKDSFTLGHLGAVLGGPIVKQKTFYFFSYEKQLINATQEESFAVPTVEQRGAFGSGATGIARDPFSNSTASIRVRPVGFNAPIIFSLFPFANNPQGVYGRNTFTQTLPANARGNVFSAKLEHNFKLAERTQSATGRYNLTDDQRTIPVTGGALFSALKPRVRAQNFSFFFNSQVSAPNAATEKFNQVRLSYGRTRLQFDEVRDNQFLLPASTPFLLNAPVLTNITTPSTATAPDIVYLLERPDFAADFPLGQVNVAGFAPLGVDVYNFPQRRVNNTYQLADVFTLRHGDHNLAFGLDTRRSELNSELPRVARTLVNYNGGPRLVNEGGSVRLPTATDPTPFLRAEDLVALDAPSAFFLTLDTAGIGANIGLRYYQRDFFGQDDWKLRPNLSLSFGLRYEYNTPPHEVHDLIERTFNDPALNQVPALRTFIGGRTEIFEPDRNNFAPRFGLAYSPKLFGRDRVTVFRGGYGVFYDQALGAVVSQSRNVFPTFLTLNFGGFRVANTNGQITFNSPARFSFLNGQPLVKPGTLNQLNPAVGLTATLNYLNGVGTSGGQAFPDALGLTLPTRNFETPLAHHYSFAVEQQLNANATISAAYVGTLGRNLLRFTSPNRGASAVVAPLSLVAGGVPAINGRLLAPTRPVSGAGAVYLYAAAAQSRYDSLQVQMHGRLQRGLQYQLAYTYAHAVDDVSDVFDLAGASALSQNSLALDERGAANFDVRHRFSTYYIYDFSTLSSHWLLRGLQLAGTGQFNTGPPFTVNSLFDINLDGNLTDRLDTLSGIARTGEGRQPLRLQTENTVSLLAPLGRDGRIGRNTFRAGGLAVVDLAVIKQFQFAGRKLGVRTEFFNLFNRANFGIPVRWLEAPGFGLATRTVTPARRIQFALKYEF
ncbi:MAG: carboxypeptidase regulatory-like domain-containing protein [Acidobacteria bacterium]|nr:carboxypeptidase regulatory-like domain-containing protein [Acidobacteriota bacterium]